MKKPGALRNGAPFKDWDLPPALAQVRAKLKQHADGDRQFVMCWAQSSIMGWLRAPPSIATPDALRLKIEPTADCNRYDSIRKVA